MKIQDCTERNCCDIDKDMRPYRGELGSTTVKGLLRFCVHCGQIWWRLPMDNAKDFWNKVNMSFTGF